MKCSSWITVSSCFQLVCFESSFLFQRGFGDKTPFFQMWQLCPRDNILDERVRYNTFCGGCWYPLSSTSLSYWPFPTSRRLKTLLLLIGYYTISLCHLQTWKQIFSSVPISFSSYLQIYDISSWWRNYLSQ